MKKIFITVFVAALTFATLGLPGTVSAASASMSISGSSHTVGDTFTASVYENGGADMINTVDAYFSISDKSKLQVTGISYSGAFEKASPAPACTADFCVLAGVIGSGLANSQLVAVVSFKALASGTVTVSFNSNSRIVSGATNTAVASDKVNGTYTISAAPASNPAQTPAPTAPTTPGSSNNNSTKKTTTTPNSATTAAATTPETETPTGEVKSESDKKDDDKKDDKKADKTADTSNKSNVWTGILVAIAAGFAFFAGRRYVAQKAAIAKAKEDAKAAAATAAATKKTKQPKKHNKKSTK